jgi:hypothetical protein
MVIKLRNAHATNNFTVMGSCRTRKMRDIELDRFDFQGVIPGRVHGARP